MSKKQKELSRRDFIKVSSAAGISVIGLSAGVQALAKDKPTPAVKPAVEINTVPTRMFGKSKIPVSMLSLGGIFDITNNLIMLKKCLDLGVTYWDTADCYVGGNSEIGIGMFFEKFPETRKKVFLVSKSDKTNTAGMTELFNRSLERMKTDYIDLYFLHGKGYQDLTPEVKAWAEKMKKEKKIKLFGFSTHNNMAMNLMEASKLGWVDGIMPAYNYRLMHEEAMKKAVDACYKAGIGITAMKTQGGSAVKTDSDAELALAGKFVQKGFTPQQAKLKAIWSNPAICSICSQMPNLAILSANAAAAMDKTTLQLSDFRALKQYAAKTCSTYCEGCSDICDGAMNTESKIADVMRYMMYYRSYGNAEMAINEFAKLPAHIRETMDSVDYSAAESRCPRNLEISKIMKDAVKILA